MEKGPAIVQCKHVSAFARIEDIEQRYFPQVMHECPVTGAAQGFLSVFVGTHHHVIAECRRDALYIATLLQREREFWRYVETDTPPPEPKPLVTPIKPEEWRTVDFSNSNSWGSAAGDWLANRAAAKAFGKAEKTLKALIEPDVGRAFGAGIVAVRNKAGGSRSRKCNDLDPQQRRDRCTCRRDRQGAGGVGECRARWQQPAFPLALRPAWRGA